MALLYGSKRILERSNNLKYTCNLYSQHQYVLRTWNVQKNLPTILVSASYELRSPGHFVQLLYLKILPVNVLSLAQRTWYLVPNQVQYGLPPYMPRELFRFTVTIWRH